MVEVHSEYDYKSNYSAEKEWRTFQIAAHPETDKEHWCGEFKEKC